MRGHLVASLVCVAACGGDRGASGVSPQASGQPQPQPQTPIDAAAPDAEPAAVRPTRSCVPAHAATLGECSNGLDCVLLLAIDERCVVTVANQLDVPDVASQHEGGGIVDLAWPKKDGPLYLVNSVLPSWSWAELPSPLTAARDALGKVTWTPTKVGEPEPEGYEYGLVSDGTNALLAGCAKWADHCGPDAQECEEWYCARHAFLDLGTKKKLAKAPSLPFVTGPKTGTITDGVTLGKKGKEKTCDLTSDSAPPDLWYEEPLDGSIALSATDWLALRYTGASRMNKKWDVDVTYMRGCSGGYRIVEGELVVGPNQLWARSVELGWELQRGPYGDPLTDATGKIKVFGSALIAFAVD